MKVTTEMMGQYVKALYEKRQDSPAAWAAVAGVLQAQLKFALDGEMERKIVIDHILEEIAVDA